jgi:hypothetical protein
MAMAIRLSSFHPPWFSPAEFDSTESELSELGDDWGGALRRPPVRPGGSSRNPTFSPGGVVARDGTWHPTHYFFYAAAAIVPMWAARLLGVHLNWAFTFVNVGLLLTAMAVVVKRVHWVGALLIFIGPVVWFADKAHTETFTFALVALGVALVRDRPGWSLICVGAAAAQNPPLLGGVAALALAAVAINPGRLREGRFWLGGGVGAALAVSAPLYYKIRLDSWSIAATGLAYRPHVPSVKEWTTAVLDPNVGLLPNAPLLGPIILAVILGLLLYDRSRLIDPAVVAAAVLVGVVLLATAWGTNVNHGGTVHVIRYALWMLPSLVALLMVATRSFPQRFWVAMAPFAVASAVISIAAFRPARPEVYTKPTRLAEWIWTNHPDWDNPLPEVFFERNGGERHPIAPVAIKSCNKVLIVSGGWPESCDSAPNLPKSCRTQGSICYANRHGTGYRFVVAIRRLASASEVEPEPAKAPPWIIIGHDYLRFD